MKVDFRKIEVQPSIEGKKEIVNISKEFGNMIYNQTADIAMGDLAKDIYYKGEVELTKEQSLYLCKLIQNIDWRLPFKLALLSVLNIETEKVN